MSKSGSQNSSDEPNPLTMSVEESREYINSSLIDINVSQEQREITTHQSLLPAVSLEETQNYSFEPQPVQAKKNKSALQQLSPAHTQVIFNCPGGKTAAIERRSLQDLQEATIGSPFERNLLPSKIIKLVVLKLCQTQFDFTPLNIRTDSFLLSLTHDGQRFQLTPSNVDQIATKKSVDLQRRERKLASRLRETLVAQKEEEVVEILSPDKQDFMETVTKSKNIAQLKAKISSHFPQLVGEMILVSYDSFTLLNNRLKIADLPQKVVEIYQERKTFIDPTFLKHQTISPFPYPQQFSILCQEEPPITHKKMLISESPLMGRLFLQVEEGSLKETVEGGVMGYLQGERVKRRSLMTLLAAKCEGRRLQLQFFRKEGCERVSYDFSSEDVLRQVLTSILIKTRDFSHTVELLS